MKTAGRLPLDVVRDDASAHMLRANYSNHLHQGDESRVFDAVEAFLAAKQEQELSPAAPSTISTTVAFASTSQPSSAS